MNYLLARLTEPSTWAGIALVGQTLADHAATIATAGASWPTIAIGILGGLAAIIAKEGGASAK